MEQMDDINRLSVLFVDDEEKSLKYFKKAFSDNFSILTASSANEAETILNNEGEKIAVLITDQRMPECTGLQLLHSVRKKQPNTIRMLTTAYSDLDDTIEAVNDVGIFRYISKPWQMDDVSASLSSAMNLFVRQQRLRNLVEERKKSMLSLACSIAHELRVSLLKIGGTAWELNDSLPALLTAYESITNDKTGIPDISGERFQNLKHVVHDVSQEVDRGNAIIDMLLMNAADNNEHALLSDMCSICGVVESALSNYPFRGNQKNLVTCDINEDFLFFGSSTLVRHILFNLIKNSLNAISNVGKGEIKIGLSKTDAANYLHVRDTGGGIAEEDIPFVFDDFFSSNASFTNAGLGLSFCKRTIQSIGGDIICYSRRNEFTEFVLRFPSMQNNSPN